MLYLNKDLKIFFKRQELYAPKHHKELQQNKKSIRSTWHTALIDEKIKIK